MNLVTIVEDIGKEVEVVFSILVDNSIEMVGDSLVFEASVVISTGFVELVKAIVSGLFEEIIDGLGEDVVEDIETALEAVLEPLLMAEVSSVLVACEAREEAEELTMGDKAVDCIVVELADEDRERVVVVLERPVPKLVG